MSINRLRRTAAMAAAVGLAFALTACADDDDATDDDGAPDDTEQDMDDGDDEGDDGAADQTFGAACDAIPDDPDDPGSLEGMSEEPVATAASNNPVLETLVAAVDEAGLVDDLNDAEALTVFAPTNEAFDEVEGLDEVMADEEMLTQVLTYHVIPERITPEQLGADGPFESMQGGDVEVEGEGESFTVNGDSQVACGNVQTANATVYIVDTVLMPEM